MSAQPSAPAAPPDFVNIEIDGKPLQVPKNSMIIAGADKAGIPIPRFCYHQKLPIAANCRMCMVEVEMGGRPMPKPQPACATPVAEGMKIFTQSQRALSAQRNVMEFLLINHPLDCPICDQGGECELQDMSVGYGRSVSRFVERKRVVPDEDIGPLIETEMTRCIQCTRCVRFVSEVAGTYELGGMGRGEHLEIGTYIGKTIESELGGNIIDVCPVGALTNKVFRFKARAWELIARESIGYHDALGSNLWLHTRRGEVLRTVPRDNESINECWLSDRDRYSHQALAHADRAQKPLIRKNGELVESTWDEAIAFVAQGLKQAGTDLGAIVAPMTSSEEGYLLAKLVRGLGSDGIDHRLRATDLADAAAGAIFELPVAQVEKAKTILLIGSNPRHDLPLLGARIRKAWKHGAKIYAVNPVDFDFNFELAGKAIVLPSQCVAELAALCAAAGEGAEIVPSEIAALIGQAQPTPMHRDAVKALKDAGSSVLIFGDYAVNHANASMLRALAKYLAQATNSAFNEAGIGANAVGLTRVGVMPQGDGRNAAAMLAQPPKSLIVFNAGSQDTGAPASFEAARSHADFCVYIGAYACSGVKRTAHAVLPIGLPPEIDGTYVNLDGVVQTVAAGSKLPGDARPGWRVLRALGAQLGISGFDATDIHDVRAAIKPLLSLLPPGEGRSTRQRAEGSANVAPSLAQSPRVAGTLTSTSPRAAEALQRIATVPIYRADSVLRRCAALQTHPLTGTAAIGLNPEDALSLGLSQGASAKVTGGDKSTILPVIITRAVPRGGAWIEAAWPETSALPADGSILSVTRG
jgi:NADH-quinone oxidoreductase subunit G